MCVEKVFWYGRHPALKDFSSPLGKLPKPAIDHLRSIGWRQIETSDASAPAIIPAFAWTTRKAGNFPAAGDNLPLVRPLPQACTAVLDDKLSLAHLTLSNPGLRSVSPCSYVDLEALLVGLQQQPTMDETPRRYFVKHRFGVKGQAVRPMGEAALCDWLVGLGASARRSSDFVVQAEVAPPALWEGRKFAVRCHCLVAASGRQTMPSAWLHRDVIILPHAAPFDTTSDDRAVHVSQAGRNHPAPILAAQVPADHPAAQRMLWPRLRRVVAHCLSAAHTALVPPAAERCQRSTLFSVLACDVTLSADGAPWLLEVNSHCALGDGTMAAVDPEVYTRLVRDVASLLVLPALDPKAEPSPGGFEALDGFFVLSSEVEGEGRPASMPASHGHGHGASFRS